MRCAQRVGGTLACMSARPRALPDALGTAFTCADAIEAGVTRRRRRAADLDATFRGARLRPSSPDETEDAGTPLALDRRMRRGILARAHAYALVAPAGSFFVGTTALAVHGLPLPRGADTRPLEVGVPAPLHAPRGRGVRGVKVSRRLVRIVESDGLIVADPASTWALAGTGAWLRDLVVWGDALVRVPRDERAARHPERRLATADELRAAALVPWRRSRDTLLAALELVREGSMSPLETDFRLAARAAGLPEPELDVELRDGSGRLIGVSDLVYRAHRVVVEIEGRQHRTSDAQWNRDLDKYAALTAAGWEVVRLTARHVRPGTRGVELVADALRRRLP